MDIAGRRKAGKAAIGTGDHILSPDDPGKACNALRDSLRMLDEIGSVHDDPGN